MDTTLPEAELRRNFILGVINGAAYRLSLTLLDGAIVLPWFVSQVTSSRLIVGLFLPIQNAGWSLPQLFASQRLQSRPRRLPAYNWACAVRGLFLAGLALAPFLLGPDRPGLLLLAAIVTFAGYWLVGGITGLAFQDMVAQGIHPRQRGNFFAWRNLTGGLLAVAGSALVSQLMGPHAPRFPYAFGALAFACLVAFLAMWFALTPWREVDHRTRPAGLAPRALWAILRHDHNLRGQLLSRILFIGSGVTTSYFVIHARDLVTPAQYAGLFLLAYTVTELCTNLLWGWVSDHVSNKVVLGLTGALALAQNLLAATFRSDWPPALYLLIFVILGLIQSGSVVCGGNLLIEAADPGQRSTYIGLANTILGAFTLLLPLGGVVAQLLGLRPLFVLAAVLAGGGLLSLLAWQDPRSPDYRRPADPAWPPGLG